MHKIIIFCLAVVLGCGFGADKLQAQTSGYPKQPIIINQSGSPTQGQSGNYNQGPPASRMQDYNLDTYMSKQDQAAYGLNRLGDSERAGLAQWLSRYKPDAGKNTAESTYYYRITSNFNSGAEIHLDNNTTWRIAPQFHSSTRYWMPDQRVEIGSRREPYSNFPQSLFNQNTGETVDAKQVNAGAP